MSEIADLENRLSAALDRIAQGLDKGFEQATVADGSDTPETAVDTTAFENEIKLLQDALAQERQAKEILVAEVERLKDVQKAPVVTSVQTGSDANDDEIDALKAAHAAEIEALHVAAAAERQAWEGLNSRVVRMRRSNKLMRSNTIALRQAAADQVADADLINQSLQLELQAAETAQELERAEVDVILKTLQPLLGDPVGQDETGETA